MHIPGFRLARPSAVVNSNGRTDDGIDGVDATLPKPSNRRIVFFVVSLALSMASIDATIVATALHTMDHDLHAQVNWGAWTITAYSLGRITTLPSVGKIGDKYGRRKIFLLSVIVFTISSLLCGLTVDIYMLVALRFIQALGGGAFMPMASGIVADQFKQDRDRAIGMLSSIIPIGGIIGPIFGGLFVTYWSWRGIFLINVPIGIVLFLLTLKYIPVVARKDSEKPDVRGITLMSLFILAAMFGITDLGEGRPQLWSPDVLLPILFALGLGWVFFRHLKQARDPVIPLRLIRGNGFGVMNIINILFGVAALGFGSLVPLYAQDRYGIAALASGTLLTARAIGTFSIAGLTTFALRRTGYRLPMMLGFFILAVGTIATASSPHGLSPYGWLALSSGISGLGLGLVTPSSNNAGMQLDPGEVASISGLRGTFRLVGSIIGVSVTSAVIAMGKNSAASQTHVFVVFAIVLALVVPCVMLVPDHRGKW